MRMFLPLLLLLGTAATPAPAQDDVTIYRCTDAQGRLALQDFPCADEEQQQVRTMARPRDPAPRTDAGAAPAPAAAPEPPAVDVVVRSPPRPMFECITPDGERYTSDSGDGNPRPAPVWNWDSGLWAGPGPGVPPGPRGADRRAAGIASPGMSTSPGPGLTTPSQARTAPPPTRPGRPGHRRGYGWGYDAGIIRDECHRLPQARACSVLNDRRTEIRRRMFNAQPSERAVLREEERDITARLNEDCDIR
ncbi:DUF4124 domain-containing protein [Luteimonas dalianensis]|uniref:DUF4124 domain-containing protein n=1 Tax=Luteimonas dalianensis TaxID=1148196 RepID=UPI003BF442E2